MEEVVIGREWPDLKRMKPSYREKLGFAPDFYTSEATVFSSSFGRSCRSRLSVAK